MARRNRYFESGAFYEVIFSAREGLPLPCRIIIELILRAALAWALRDDAVILCHFVWMGNHAHLLVICKDAKQFAKFYGELQKRITDCLKALLGLPHLDLWQGSPVVIRIADLGAAIKKAVYIYSNPPKAGLVESIEEYPGYSSWQAFQGVSNALDACFQETAPWVELPDMPRALSKGFTERQDQELAQQFLAAKSRDYQIKIFPNAWMKCFGIEDPAEIQGVNRQIRLGLREAEDDFAAKRKRPVIGAAKLRRQALMRPHTPKKRDRRVFVMASCSKLRKQLIDTYNAICALCAECYSRYLHGDFLVRWPPGTFPPPLPPLANALA
jgi:hypothetical protein